MIGKILGGIAGKQFADQTSGVSGPAGMLAGAVAGSVLRRAGIPALIALTAGGYVFKKWSDKRDADKAKRERFQTPPKSSAAA